MINSRPQKIALWVVHNLDQVLELKPTPACEMGKRRDILGLVLALLGYLLNTCQEFVQRISLEGNWVNELEKISRPL